MKQEAYAVMWGVLEENGGKYPSHQLPQLLDKLKSLGYTGIEMTITGIMKYGSSKFQALLKEKGMKVVCGVFSSGPPPTPATWKVESEFGIEHPGDDTENFHNVARHQAVWRGQISEIERIRDVVHAVTTHTGRDYFTAEEADEMFAYCLQVEADTGLQINHETHRARMLYSPWVISRFLDKFPALHLVADYSHYSCVAELGGCAADVYSTPLHQVIAKCNPRVRHIHARVGFEEGPQIPDPRTDTWRPYFDGYMAWWKGIMIARAAAGQAVLSTTPEFGPPAYAWTNPYDKDTPIVNVWDVNHYTGLQLCKAMGELGHEGAKLVEDAEKGVWQL